MAEPTKTCPSCGERIRASVSFCTMCGAPTDAAPPEPTGRRSGPPRPGGVPARAPAPGPTSVADVGLVLEVVAGPNLGQRFPLRGPTEVGRDPGCGVVLPSDEMVSRRHARLTPSGDQLLVEDLGSTNGTIVNGDVISTGRRVGIGDRITVGDTALELRRA